MAAALQKIVIIDDHPILAEALVSLLQNNIGDVSVTVASVATSLDFRDYTLALIDIYLKDMSGIDLITQAHNAHPAPIIVAMSGDDRYETQYDAFAAGAQAFIAKSAQPERIEAVLNFLLGRSRDLPRLLDSRIALGQPAIRPVIRDLELSPREREIIMLIGQGLSNEAIAAALSLSINTVKQHVTRLLATHGAENRTQLLQTIARGTTAALHPKVSTFS